MKPYMESKTGNGAFKLRCYDDGTVDLQIENDRFRKFQTRQIAYDWCRGGYTDLQGTMRGYSYLNAAYALEDAMAEA